MKPYYEQDGIVIYHGDCRDAIGIVPAVDLLLTDPPYGIGCDVAIHCTKPSRPSRGRLGWPRFQGDRPADGYCYLDFLDRWLWDAVYSTQDADRAYRYAREIGHWALLMHPELAPLPHNVVLGEN